MIFEPFLGVTMVLPSSLILTLMHQLMSCKMMPKLDGKMLRQDDASAGWLMKVDDVQAALMLRIDGWCSLMTMLLLMVTMVLIKLTRCISTCCWCGVISVHWWMWWAMWLQAGSSVWLADVLLRCSCLHIFDEMCCWWMEGSDEPDGFAPDVLVAEHHCFTNKYRTGKLSFAIIFRLQVQIPNSSELIIISGTVFPGNQTK